MITHRDSTLAPLTGPGLQEPAPPGTAISGQPPSKPPGRKKPILLALTVVLAALIGGVIYHRATTGTGSPSAAGPRGGAMPVPVVEGIVAVRDVPIYLDGLGTVQAFNTVTVRARVDGQIVNVAFTEGHDVKAGDVLAQLDAAPYKAVLDQAVARKAQDEAQLANARLDLDRYAGLLKTDSITQQIYDTQKALIAQLEATIKADQAAIDSARVNLDYTTIRSPIDGRVGIRQVDVGNIVHASDSTGLVVVTQLRPISVIFTLPEQALARLQQFQDPLTPFTVLAVARDNTSTLATGTVSVVDNLIDTTTGTIKLKANFANEELRLWPGQFVNTRLLLTTRKASPVVPASVVQRGPDGPFAFVIQDDQTVEMRPLKVAQIEAGTALIDSGLAPAERVVVDGQYKLQPGAHVRPADSPTDAAPGAPISESAPGARGTARPTNGPPSDHSGARPHQPRSHP
jgi:multidrug efflux system membrane fusion protein